MWPCARSATGEDGADASFAGMNATFTNISGEEQLIDAVQRCWASLFGPRVVTCKTAAGSPPTRRWRWWFSR